MDDGGNRDDKSIGGPGIDVTSSAFGRRLANVLAERRRQRGKSLRSLARHGHHAFTAKELRAFEEGEAVLSVERIDAVVELYDVNIDEILPERVGLAIRPYGVLSTSGLTAPFIPNDSTSLLLSYLKLVRQLRAQQQAPMVELRREDVEVLAEFIGESGTTVIERLGALMGATVTQRRAMAGLFVAGAMVIGLAGGSVAAINTDGGSNGSPVGAAPTTTLVILDAHGAPVTDATTPGAPDTAPMATALTTPEATSPETAPSTTTPTSTTPTSTTPTSTTPTSTTPTSTTPTSTTPTSTGSTSGSTSGAGSHSSGANGTGTPTTTAPAGTTPTTTTPTTTPASDGGSIFDDDVPTEAAPLPPSVDDTVESTDGTTPAGDTAVDEPPVAGGAGDPTYTDPGAGDTGAAPADETGEQATDVPPVPFAAWRVLAGDTVSTDGSAVRATGWSCVQATAASFVEGSVRVDATLVSGPGFGVFVRSHFDDRARVTSGWSVQVDTGWGKGALLVRRWSNDWETHPVAVTDVARERLFGSHTLTIDIVGDLLHAQWNGAEVQLDLGDALRRLGRQWGTSDGDHVAVRTWGTTLLHVDGVDIS